MAARSAEPALITLRLQAQLLTETRATTVDAVVSRLLAVQAQELAAARLAVRARSGGLRAGAIDDELTGTRELVVTWLNRGTLHLVRAEDYWWLHPLTAPGALSANARVLRGSGLSSADAQRGLAVIEKALTRDGPMGQAQLRDRLRSADVAVAGPAGYLLLAWSGLSGTSVRGPMIDGKQAYVLARDWIGRPPPPLSRERALTELARRYLLGHGPADHRDLARWAGIGLAEARAGLGRLGRLAIERADGRLELAARAALDPRLRVRLLGGFDPIMFGWLDRGLLLGRHEAALVTRNGLFRPAILVGERVIGTWHLAAGAPVLEPFEPLSERLQAALRRDAGDVERFLARAG